MYPCRRQMVQNLVRLLKPSTFVRHLELHVVSLRVHPGALWSSCLWTVRKLVVSPPFQLPPPHPAHIDLPVEAIGRELMLLHPRKRRADWVMKRLNRTSLSLTNSSTINLLIGRLH